MGQVFPSYSYEDAEIVRLSKLPLNELINSVHDSSVSVGKTDMDGKTLLHYVAKYNADTHVLKFLLEQGMEVNVMDNYGETPLHWAAANNSLTVIKFLIENGAKFYVLDKYQRSAIFRSAENPDVEVIKFFVEKKAKIDAVSTYHGDMPIHHAAKNSNIDVLKYLIEKGADCKVKNKDFEMPLHYAVRCNPNIEVLKFLIDKLDENGTDIKTIITHRDNLIYYAALNPNPEIMKYLHEKGLEFYLTNKDAYSYTENFPDQDYYKSGESGADEYWRRMRKGGVIRSIPLKQEGIDVNEILNENDYYGKCTALDEAKDENIKQILRDAGGKSYRQIREW
jgi:ankyrin repeat protein